MAQRKQRGFVNFSVWPFIVAAGIFGALLMWLVLWVVPKAWAWLKPFLHAWTA